MAKLNLTRPLAFFDIEATGLNVVTDRIVEISILKIYPPDGNKKEIRTLRINPTVPIPAEATKVHGISDKDIMNAPTFAECAREIADFFGDSDLAGYNCNYYDIPLLMEEFLRTDVDFNMKDRKIVDVQAIFHKKEERTLSAAYKFYCSKELNNAHSAEADVNATHEILEAQLEKYHDLKNDVQFLHNFTSGLRRVDFHGKLVYNEKGHIVFNFGKHTGKNVEDIFKNEPSYYSWMMNGEFSIHTKKIITDIYQKVKTKNL